MKGLAGKARGLAGALCLALVAQGGQAQDLAGVVRLDPARSQVRDAGAGLVVELGLSAPVPWRIYMLDAPPRLVLEVREVDFSAIRPEALLNADNARSLRSGSVRPGWSRMEIELAAPLLVEEAGMDVSPDGQAALTLRLGPASAAAFAAASGAPVEPGWPPALAPPAPETGPLIVALDPGHGGRDPGAERAGRREADLMLALAVELAEAIDRTEGLRAVLTRSDDSFVPLAARMSRARAAGADLLLSLHADALEEGQAEGASIYTLSDEAVDRASARMAERHDREDLLGGLDLSGQDDSVATALMDLARLETGPASDRLARALVEGLRSAGTPVNSRPLRRAPLAVLNAADFPSVLVETGFLSSEADRARLASPEGRAALVRALLAGLERFAAGEAARTPLNRR